MAVSDFELLLVTIKNLNQELDTLKGKIATARAELATVKEPARREQLGRTIGGYTTAAGRKQEQLSFSTTAAQTALKNMNDLLETTEKNITQLSSTEIAKGAGVAKQLEKELELRQRLVVEVERMNAALKQVSVPSGVGYIPGGAGSPSSRVPKRTNDDTVPSMVWTTDDKGNPIFVNQADAFKTTMPNRNTGYHKAPFAGRGQMAMDFDPMASAANSAKNASWSEWAVGARAKQRVTKAQELERLEQERINGLKDIIRADKRYANAIKQAEKQGFTLDDLKDIRTRGTGNIQQLQFQRNDDLGIRRNLDIYSSPSGRATPGLSNQFRTFGQGVVRDIGELTKWSLALAAVYGPVQKLGELTQEMIENQTKLAEATVAVNSAFIGQAEIFNIAADAATKAGEDVSGVIDAFTVAYRAAGGGADQVERLATAQTLLSNALILSKLSTLDQATAIDTLAAAIRQTTGNFEDSTTLLDSWVRVTKVANVDLTTLATGFAVLGDAADAAGIDMNQLNGIIAAVAETGVASGKEAANTARAIVSGFQSDQARKELEALGIAVEDASGQMRPFLDIMQEVYNLRDQKIIDDTQFSRLTLALGGGTRRQAAYATFIENFNRVSEIAQESSQASGDAESALAKQLETVQTSLTRLANAFSELAQTMGQEGGFLSIIQISVDGLTALVKAFDGLISLLGKATPMMAAFIATTAVLKYKGLGSAQSYVGGLVETTQPMVNGQMMLPGMGLNPRQRTSNFVGQNILGTNAWSGIAQGLLLSAIPAIMSATNKEDRYGGTRAGASIIGGVGGGIIGSLTGAGPIIGATIGTAIANAFVESTIARKTDLFGYAGAPEIGGRVTAAQSMTDREKALIEAEAGLYKSIGFGNEGLGKFISSPGGKLEGYMKDLNTAIKEQDKGALRGFTTPIGNAELIRADILKSAGITPDMIKQAFSAGKEITVSPERYAYNAASEEARRQYDAALAAYRAAGGEGGGGATTTAFSELVKENKDAYGQVINTLRETSKTELGQQRLAGDIKGADYARRMGALGGFDVKALQYFTAFGDEFIKINKDVDDATDAFEAFNQVILSGMGDTVPEITSVTSEIEKLINILGDPTLQTDEELLKFGFEDISDVKKRLEELRGTGASLMTDVYNQARLNQLEIPELKGDFTKPLQKQEYGLVLQTAKQMQDDFYQGFLDIPDEMYDGLKESWDSWAQIIEDSGQIFYETVTGIDPQFFQQAMSKLMEEGKLGSQAANPFNIQQLDITSGQGANLQATIDYFSQYLASNFPQYQQNPEDVGVIFSDYVTDVLHGDNLAIKLALEKIVDLNQKQLDGMYNIPEGATFWVPLTAAYYRPENQGSGMGMPTVDSAVVDGNTTATEQNTRALDQLREHLLRENAQDINPDKYAKDRQLAQQRQQLLREYGQDSIARQKAPNRYGQYEHLMREYRNETAVKPETNTIEARFAQAIDGLKTFLSSIFGQREPAYGGSYDPTVGRGSVGSRDMTNAAPVLSARLDFRVENSTQLIVDGRVLASVVTPYLASDLLRLEASQGTITKRYVI